MRLFNLILGIGILNISNTLPTLLHNEFNETYYNTFSVSSSFYLADKYDLPRRETSLPPSDSRTGGSR